MRFLASRSYRYLNLDTLEECDAKDSLLKSDDGSMMLFITSDAGDEKVVHLAFREALIWLNEPKPLLGYDW